MRKSLSRRAGFTLIELLIVVAIIAILAIIIIVAINPAKMLAKSRDSQRFSDVTSLATAINLYLADGQILTANGLINNHEYKSIDIADAGDAKQNNGTGWIPLNFTSITSGAPLAALPLDPYQDKDPATYYYAFGADTANKTYEITCKFENEDNVGKESADGGNDDGRYEVGTDLTVLAP